MCLCESIVLLEFPSFFLVCHFTGNISLKRISSVLVCFTWQFTFSSFPAVHHFGHLGWKDILNLPLPSVFAPLIRSTLIWGYPEWGEGRESRLVLLESWGPQAPHRYSSVQSPAPGGAHFYVPKHYVPKQACIILVKQTILLEGTSNSSRQRNNSWLLDQ